MPRKFHPRLVTLRSFRSSFSKTVLLDRSTYLLCQMGFSPSSNLPGSTVPTLSYIRPSRGRNKSVHLLSVRLSLHISPPLAGGVGGGGNPGNIKPCLSPWQNRGFTQINYRMCSLAGTPAAYSRSSSVSNISFTLAENSARENGFCTKP